MTETGILQRLAGTLLAAIVTAGCAGTTKPGPPRTTARAAAPELRKLAEILRAEDRRQVDGALRAALSDADARVRVAAVRAIGRISPPGARADLEAAITDPDAAVRREAARGLGLVGDPAGAVVLSRASADPAPAVRETVAEALGRLRSPDGEEAAVTLLEDPEPRVQEAACLAAWKLPDPHAAVATLARLARSTRPRIQFAAAYALGRLGASGLEAAASGSAVAVPADADRRTAREVLLALAGSPDPEVRMQVARGLTVPVGSRERSALAALQDDPDPRVQVVAARSFCYPGAPVDSYPLKAVRSREVPVAQAAVEGLGRIGGPLASDALVKQIVFDTRPWIRETAILALAHADPDRAAGVAAGLSKEEDPVLRAAVARGLAGRSEPAVLEIVARLLSDPDVRVQAAAVAARAGTDGPLGELLGATPSSPDPAVREAVARIAGLRLGRSSAAEDDRAEAFSLLEALWARSLEDATPIARLEAVDAASRAGPDPRARALLEKALADRDWLVRSRAVERLGSVFGTDASDKAGAASERPLEEYVEILEWARKPRAAVVTMRRTGHTPGRFVVALDAGSAPLAAWNFATLAGKGFYDGLAVHRVVPAFVVQDGDPRGDGNGDPGYWIRDEIGEARFEAGTLGMASSGKDTAGSQWFVTLAAQPHLDGRYTAFGRVIQNLPGVVLQIQPGDRVESVRIYEGNGTEPLPPME